MIDRTQIRFVPRPFFRACGFTPVLLAFVGVLVLGTGLAAEGSSFGGDGFKTEPIPAVANQRPSLIKTPAGQVPVGACCTVEGDCLVNSHDDCVLIGGDPNGAGTRCDSASCPQLRWVQSPAHSADSPDPDCFWGWGEWSVALSPRWIMADDWDCEPGLPITGVHWWGSYLGWEGEVPLDATPDSFHIGIWTDIQRDYGPPFSRPGEVIHEWIVPFDSTKETQVARSFHTECTLLPEVSFRYEFAIPEGEEFYQDDACLSYWLSIAAVYDVRVDPTHPWGWQTRGGALHEPGLRITEPKDATVGAVYLQGGPIPELSGDSWDMAFVLATCQTQAYGDQAPGTIGDGVVDGQDFNFVLDAYMEPERFHGGDVFPCDGDGVVDLDDVLAMLKVLLGERECPNRCL